METGMKKGINDSKTTSLSTREKLELVHEIYSDVQLLRLAERKTDRVKMVDMADNWKDFNIPALQRRVVEQQLKNLKEGIVDPVFVPLVDALNSLDLERFSLLDAACATGYYSEVIRLHVTKEVKYRGSDYSEAMIKEARRYYRDLQFDVEDLTKLTYPSNSFDVVLLSGVLEHIPDFHDAISEACRVCSSYVLLHRCPLTSSREYEYTKGSQYNIATPRIYFPQDLFINEFRTHGFIIHRKIDMCGKAETLMSCLKSIFKKVFHGSKPESPRRTVATFVFRSG